MTAGTMQADLLAAQREMPTLQRTAINPHFKHRYVPLDELIMVVLPVLNKHNFVLLQQPTVQDEQPALRTVLLHATGEALENTMLLQATKDDPQQQGAAITYARRYALLSWLGLSADADDDGESARSKGGREQPAPAARPTGFEGIPAPSCPQHDVVCRLLPGGTSKATGKPYSSFYACPEKGCGAAGKSWTVFADKWAMDWQLRQPPGEAPMTEEEAFAGMPHE